MDCQKAKNLLLLYWELSGSQQERINAHLKNCSGCEKEFASLNHSLQVLRKTAQVDYPSDAWSDYWNRLSRQLTKPTLVESIRDRFKSFFSPLSRPVWGPVPVYAFATIAILIALIAVPISRNSNLNPVQPLASNITIEQNEPVLASSRGTLTVYTLETR
ncbi:MAG: zf-HC2 domain-containing protein [candidate division Zixibacteria bacterium]|nr:zf-HC2 domain-containing protein [candidate division Zixibacteria bacterium]